MDALTPAHPTLAIQALAKAAVRGGKETIVAALIAATVFYLGLILLGYQPMVMVTGSMQKTIPVGSLVIAESVDPGALEVGDVISFEKPIGGNGIDTHRIVAVKRDHGKLLYQTKGDSNPRVDPWVIQFEQGMTAHRVVFSVPHAGHALLFVRSAPGRIALIALACLLLLLGVLKAIAATAVRNGGTAVPAAANGDRPDRAESATDRRPSTPARPQIAPASAIPSPEVRPSSPATAPRLPLAQLAVGGAVIMLGILGLRHL